MRHNFRSQNSTQMQEHVFTRKFLYFLIHCLILHRLGVLMLLINLMILLLTVILRCPMKFLCWIHLAEGTLELFLEKILIVLCIQGCP
jgi:hypothetical protein